MSGRRPPYPPRPLGLRLGVAHELGFSTTILSAILIVLLGGELPLFAWILCLGPPVSSLLALQGVSPPALSATLVGLASLALGGVTIGRGGIESSVLGGTEVLLGLLTARLLVRRTPAHDLQAILLSLLVVLAGSVLNVGMSYLFVLVVYAVAVVWALCTRQLLAGVPEADRAHVRQRRDVVTPAFFGATAGISLAVLASAAVVFALFPRVGFGDLGVFLSKETRLPTAVGLRGDPRSVGGNDVVARAWNVPRASFEDGLYLRGAVYDVITLDGFAQSRQSDERRPSMLELAEPPEHARYEVSVMPVVGDTLLTLGGVAAVRPLGGGALNPNRVVGVAGRSSFDEMKAVQALRSPMRYEVAGGIASPGYMAAAPARRPRPLDDVERARWTALPPGFDPALRSLAAGITAGAADARTTAASLRHFFLERFRYSQDPPRFASAPLRSFLVEDRQGHCEFFAAGFALLLRSQGLPARVVGGFQGGAWDDDVVVFQERHAHAWVEWWDEDRGWIVDDATPLAAAPREELTAFASALDRARRFWDDSVIDYSMQDQVESLAQARRRWRALSPSVKAFLLGVGVPAGLALAVGLALRLRRRGRPRDDAHPLARVIVDALTRRRAPVDASWTLREAVESAGGDGPFAAALREALVAYERARFGGGDVSRAEIRRLRRALRGAVRAR